MKIVGITGKAGSGKDTVADYLVARHQYTKISWADTLKAMLAVAGFPEPPNRDDKEKQIEGFDFTWRDAAQKLGTEWGRGLDPEIWVKITERRVRRATDRVVISDVRFENESAAIRRMGGKVLFLAGRAADIGAAASHASEAGISFYPTQDALIDNSGTFDFTSEQVRAALGLVRA